MLKPTSSSALSFFLQKMLLQKTPNLLSEAASALAEGDRPGRSLQEAVAARIACHASVRGSTVLGSEEFNSLLKQLDQARDPEHCPHGRPTRLKFSLQELRKLFKRS